MWLVLLESGHVDNVLPCTFVTAASRLAQGVLLDSGNVVHLARHTPGLIEDIPLPLERGFFLSDLSGE